MSEPAKDEAELVERMSHAIWEAMIKAALRVKP